MGDKQFVVRVDAMPLTLQALNHVPIKQVGPTTVYLSDVAHVADAWAVQQNIVHAEGKRSVLLTIIKNGDASTLDVVNQVKADLPAIQKAAPTGVRIHLVAPSEEPATRYHWRCLLAELRPACPEPSMVSHNAQGSADNSHAYRHSDPGCVASSSCPRISPSEAISRSSIHRRKPSTSVVIYPNIEPQQRRGRHHHIGPGEQVFHDIRHPGYAAGSGQ